MKMRLSYLLLILMLLPAVTAADQFFPFNNVSVTLDAPESLYYSFNNKSFTLDAPESLYYSFNNKSFTLESPDSQFYSFNTKTIILKNPNVTLPIMSNYINFPHTTNFSEVEDITAVPNLTLESAHGRIFFDRLVNADNQDYDTNVIFGDCFVAVNSTALDITFNATAYLLMNNSDGHCGDNTIYTSSDFIPNATLVRNHNTKCGACQAIGFDGTFITYRVPHFSSYAIGSNARLIIYDSFEDLLAQPNEQITFYANYSDLTNTTLTGATCTISFDQNTTQLLMTESADHYTYTRSIAESGTHVYNITCSKTGYNTLSTTDTVDIASGAAPEFTTFIPLFGIIALLALILSRHN